MNYSCFISATTRIFTLPACKKILNPKPTIFAQFQILTFSKRLQEWDLTHLQNLWKYPKNKTEIKLQILQKRDNSNNQFYLSRYKIIIQVELLLWVTFSTVIHPNIGKASFNDNFSSTKWLNPFPPAVFNLYQVLQLKHCLL